MRLNALNAAQQEFNWEKERASLIHLYRDILAIQRKAQYGHTSLSKSVLLFSIEGELDEHSLC